jgi:hypothetical protein
MEFTQELWNILQSRMIVDIMLEYQKENNIKQKCGDNTQYLIKKFHNYLNLVNAKVVPVIFVGFDVENNKHCICGEHLVIELEGAIVECSYEFTKFQYPQYFKTCKAFFENYLDVTKECKSKVIKGILKFQQDADKINSSLTTEYYHCSDRDYYKKQSEYVNKKFKQQRELMCL